MQQPVSRSANPYPANGFTLVEMIVVILLIAIISMVTMSRFIGGNAFNPLAVQGQIISIIRAGQQSSMGRVDVELTITPNAGNSELTLELTETSGTIEDIVLDMRGVSLSGDVDVTTASCDTTSGTTAISDSSVMTIVFGQLGDLEDSGFGALTTVDSAIRICLNNDSTSSICVSPAGFAYGGDCDVD